MEARIGVEMQIAKSLAAGIVIVAAIGLLAAASFSMLFAVFL